MTGVGRLIGKQPRTETVAADFLERAGKSGRITRELHGRSVGKKFALAADGGLNQASEKNADGTDAQQQYAHKNWSGGVAPAHSQKNPTNCGDAENSKKNSDKAN